MVQALQDTVRQFLKKLTCYYMIQHFHSQTELKPCHTKTTYTYGSEKVETTHPLKSG